MIGNNFFIPLSEVVGSRTFKINDTYKIEFENNKSPIIIDDDGNKKIISFMDVSYLNYCKGDMGKDSYWFVDCKIKDKELLFRFRKLDDSLPYEVVLTERITERKTNRKIRKETTIKNPRIEISENSLNIFRYTSN